MRELSVFCDESGDFGAYDQRCPYYIVSLVFHDQAVDITSSVAHLEQAISNIGFNRDLSLHTAPLIRREERFENVDMAVRRKLFNALFSFFNHCDVSFRSFVISKKEFGSGDELAKRITKVMGEFLRDNISYFQEFDRVVVYYDKGQKQITRTLKSIFSTNLSAAEFSVVQPDAYRLFQIADLACTLELLQCKYADKSISTSERDFFISMKRLKKTYFRNFNAKRFC